MSKVMCYVKIIGEFQQKPAGYALLPVTFTDHIDFLGHHLPEGDRKTRERGTLLISDG